MATHRVLVTGSAGAVGRAVCKELLARGHVVRGYDLVPTPHCTDSRVASIEDAAAVRDAAAGMDTLVHLAATVNDADFMTQIVGPNIIAVYHVLEAARQHAFRRVVLTSSAQVLSGLQGRRERVTTVEDGTWPTNYYAVSKVYQEEMGKMYHRRHKMSVVVARINWLTRNMAEVDRLLSHGWFSGFLSHDDAGRFYAAAVAHEPVEYACCFVASRRAEAAGVDLEAGRRLLGWEPQDYFPEGLPFAVSAEAWAKAQRPGGPRRPGV